MFLFALQNNQKQLFIKLMKVLTELCRYKYCEPIEYQIQYSNNIWLYVYHHVPVACCEKSSCINTQTKTPPLPGLLQEHYLSGMYLLEFNKSPTCLVTILIPKTRLLWLCARSLAELRVLLAHVLFRSQQKHDNLIWRRDHLEGRITQSDPGTSVPVVPTVLLLVVSGAQVCRAFHLVDNQQRGGAAGLLHSSLHGSGYPLLLGNDTSRADISIFDTHTHMHRAGIRALLCER